MQILPGLSLHLARQSLSLGCLQVRLHGNGLSGGTTPTPVIHQCDLSKPGKLGPQDCGGGNFDNFIHDEKECEKQGT